MICTPVTKETVHLLLKRLEDETGVKGSRGRIINDPTLRTFYHAANYLYLSDTLKLYASVDALGMNIVTWDKFVAAVAKACPKKTTEWNAKEIISKWPDFKRDYCDG